MAQQLGVQFLAAIADTPTAISVSGDPLDWPSVKLSVDPAFKDQVLQLARYGIGVKLEVIIVIDGVPVTGMTDPDDVDYQAIAGA